MLAAALRAAPRCASRAVFAPSRRFFHPEDALRLECIDVNLFRAPKEHLWRPVAARGVFGGQIIGQAMAAAHETMEAYDDISIHSMHGYFLLPGNPDAPILYHLDRVRDGRNFATRSVKAVQAGQAIFTAVMQFARPEEGKLMEHSDAMPHVPPPDDLPSLPERLGSLRTDPRIPDHLRSLVDKWLTMPFPIELRPVQPVVPDPLGPGPLPPHQLIWVRSKVPLGESADMHRCVAAFGSDWHLCTTSLLPHGMVFPTPALKMLTSLDHSMWFHAPFRADEWMLYEMRSPRAAAARGLNVGRLFRADGTLAVSVAQEGLMRLR